MDAELDESSVDDVVQSEDRIVNQGRDLSADDRAKMQQKLDDVLQRFGLQARLVVMESASLR